MQDPVWPPWMFADVDEDWHRRKALVDGHKLGEGIDGRPLTGATLVGSPLVNNDSVGNGLADKSLGGEFLDGTFLASNSFVYSSMIDDDVLKLVMLDDAFRASWCCDSSSCFRRGHSGIISIQVKSWQMKF